MLWCEVRPETASFSDFLVLDEKPLFFGEIHDVVNDRFMLFIGWWVISYAVECHLLWGKFRGRFSVVLHNLCSCSIKWSNCNVVFVVSWFWQLDIKYFLDHWVSYNGSCRNVISACFTTFIFTDNDRFFWMFFCSFIISGLLWVSWNDDMMNYLSVKIDTLFTFIVII